jgi:hypothetical protein
MTQFTSKREDNKNSPARSYTQAALNCYEALSDEDEIEDTTMEDASSSDSSDTTPVQDNAKATGSKEVGTLKHSANPLSKRSQRKAAQEKKKQDKDGHPMNLSSATMATLERAKKAKELLQKSAEDQNAVNTDSVQESITIDDSPQETSKEDQADTTPPFKEPSKGDEQKDTTSTTSKDSVNEVLTGNSLNKNKTQPPMTVARNQNPYLKQKTSLQRGILHTVPQEKNKSTQKGSIDKQITLKKGMLRPHTHRYTLRIKIISSKSEEDEQIFGTENITEVFRHCAPRGS